MKQVKVLKDGIELGTFKTIISASKTLSISDQRLKGLLHGKIKKTNGYEVIHVEVEPEVKTYGNINGLNYVNHYNVDLDTLEEIAKLIPEHLRVLRAATYGKGKRARIVLANGMIFGRLGELATNDHGYKGKYKQCTDGLVHRIVYLAFNGADSLNGLTVDHVDNDGHNNYIDNLDAVTQRANVRRRDERDNGGHRYRLEAYLNGKLIGRYVSGKQCSEKLGVAEASITNMISGKQKSCKKGYTFKRV